MSWKVAKAVADESINIAGYLKSHRRCLHRQKYVDEQVTAAAGDERCSGRREDDGHLCGD